MPLKKIAKPVKPVQKSLLTGAPGWLGTRFAELAAPKIPLRCLVLEGMSTAELMPLPLEIVKGDVTKPETLAGVCNDIDTVFHCVGIIHPKKAADFIRINVEGTRNVLEASIKAGVKRFVYISSNSAQGFNRSRTELMKEIDLCKPESGYGRSKFMAEELVRKYGEQYKMETVILRPCLYYGPRAPDRMLTLFKLVKSGKPLVFGDGLNLRSMTYIDNLIQAMILVQSHPRAKNKTFWIADKHPYTTLEIMQTIADILGVTIKPVHVPHFVARAVEIADNLYDELGRYSMNLHVVGETVRDIGCSIEHAETELGYVPEIDLKEGMRRTIAWAQQNGKI